MLSNNPLVLNRLYFLALICCGRFAYGDGCTTTRQSDPSPKVTHLGLVDEARAALSNSLIQHHNRLSSDEFHSHCFFSPSLPCYACQHHAMVGSISACAKLGLSCMVVSRCAPGACGLMQSCSRQTIGSAAVWELKFLCNQGHLLDPTPALATFLPRPLMLFTTSCRGLGLISVT